MTIVYVGPSKRVYIPAANVVAERAIPVTVDDEVAVALLRQAVWQEAVTEQPNEDKESN